MPSSTRKTTKKPQDRKYGTGWKSPLSDLTLPSGETCQVKRPGVKKLVEANILDSMDTLTGIVAGETIPKAEGRKKLDVKEVMKDTDSMTKMMDVVDKIALFCVVQPPLVSDHVTEKQALDPTSPFHGEAIDPETGKGRFIEYEERDPDLVYIDYVDDMDKMAIMSFVVGGNADLQRFREEAEAAVGGVQPSEDAPSPSE